MEKTVCRVQYFKTHLNAYGGMSYTYFTTLPLKVGDEVYAPTQSGDKRAVVVECGRTELNNGEMTFIEKIRTITRYYEKESEE